MTKETHQKAIELNKLYPHTTIKKIVKLLYTAKKYNYNQEKIDIIIRQYLKTITTHQSKVIRRIYKQ